MVSCFAKILLTSTDWHSQFFQLLLRMCNLASVSKNAQLLFVARIFVTVLLSNSIYISNAKCPMVREEPIRWQIRCQLRGSCLETITASLPPQFKFQTLQRRSSHSLGSHCWARSIQNAELFPTDSKGTRSHILQTGANHALIPIDLEIHRT